MEKQTAQNIQDAFLNTARRERYTVIIHLLHGATLAGRIRSFDKLGNTGTCTDTLNIRRDSFPLIKCADMITLSCIMKCKKPNNTGSSSDPSNFDTFTFSPDPKDPNYPTPDKLIDKLISTGFERPKEMKLANLEDVFIKLTGHSLREG